MNPISVILALLGLSFLVFIHELGHYFAAKWCKMRVEVFSIGFGKPLFSWKWKEETWQVCCILVGGYVKIAGDDPKSFPKEVQDTGSFFAKTPWQRIQVAVMGPLVNIVFALFAFIAIWAFGGFQKPFEAFTHIIGWVDPQSQLAAEGVKPGDTITSYNKKPFTGFKDLFQNGALKTDTIEIKGEKIDYYTGEKTPYSYTLAPYASPGRFKELKTIGVISPAALLTFAQFPDKVCPVLSACFSGIQEGERILWANGEIIFSNAQLQTIVNQNSAFVTIERDGKIHHFRIPRVLIADFELPSRLRDEFSDWRREIDAKAPLDALYSIPYEVDEMGIVRGPIPLSDEALERLSPGYQVKGLDEELHVGDRFLAVNYTPVSSGLDVFKGVKEKAILLAVQKKQLLAPMSWKDEDTIFTNSVNWGDLYQLTSSIGIKEVEEQGNLRLLKPIEPIKYEDLAKALDRPLVVTKEEAQREVLGLQFTSQFVEYNPQPLAVFADIVKEMATTLSSLVKGELSPKFLSGPVGIVKVMHDGWGIGLKESLYWLGLISLNLGLFNLLPIPMLDGATICFSLWEWITKKPIPVRVLDKIILPFIVLFIVFFVFITYQDISRIFFH